MVSAEFHLGVLFLWHSVIHTPPHAFSQINILAHETAHTTYRTHKAPKCRLVIKRLAMLTLNKIKVDEKISAHYT